jgi:hypothetical protein
MISNLCNGNDCIYVPFLGLSIAVYGVIGTPVRAAGVEVATVVVALPLYVVPGVINPFVQEMFVFFATGVSVSPLLRF